ncbi:MAG: hypothetical protein HFF90_06560 [Oscillibacter sp.]|nr:hypothetical protein [Oscillibacter sp.]
MGTKRPSNEDIQIGSIFKCVARDECGSSCDFYQVVGKRGKTLVELRAIRRECFLDERCKPGLGEVRVRPLPGEFKEGCKPFTVAACRRSEIDGKAILASWHEEYSCCYFEVREGETGCLYGYEGMYALEALRKAEAAEKEGGA